MLNSAMWINAYVYAYKTLKKFLWRNTFETLKKLDLHL